MSDIAIQSKLTLIEGDTTVTNAKSQFVQTRESTLTKVHHTIQNVGTSAEDLSTGDVDLAKEHDVWLRNTDTTNYVDLEFHKESGVFATGAILRPGMPFGPVRLKAQSGGYPKIRLKANTAACDVEVIVGDGGDPTA